LLLLDDDSSASSSASLFGQPTQATQQAKKPAEGDQFQGFQSFQGAASVASNDLFTGFQSATPAQPANNDAFWSGQTDSGNQGKPQASKESILQLFQTPLTVNSTAPMTPGFPSQLQQQQRPAPNYNVSLTGLSATPGYGAVPPPMGFNNMGTFGTQVPSQFPAYGYGNQMMPPSTAFMGAAPTATGYGGVPMATGGGFGGPSSFSSPGYVNPNFLASQKGSTTLSPSPMSSPAVAPNTQPVMLPTSAANFRL
jgi:hypothetical protein